MHYQTIFLSDIHLGTRGCKAQKLLDFLKDNESETIILVGDIIDVWALKRKVYWPQTHNDVIQKLLKKARKGTKIIYIPGNHDEFLRDFADVNFGNNVFIKNEYIYETLKGEKLLIIHGDKFDNIVLYNKNLAIIGDIAYSILLIVNDWFQNLKKIFNFKSKWSLSAFLKNKVKQSVNFISNYEYAVVHECNERGLKGIICGHIHHPNLKFMGENGKILYINTGDWVESCTALVEHLDGQIELIYKD